MSDENVVGDFIKGYLEALENNMERLPLDDKVTSLIVQWLQSIQLDGFLNEIDENLIELIACHIVGSPIRPDLKRMASKISNGFLQRLVTMYSGHNSLIILKAEYMLRCGEVTDYECTWVSDTKINVVFRN